MGAVGSCERKVFAMAGGRVCIVAAVLMIFHAGSARANADPGAARATSCVQASQGTGPQCLVAGHRMPGRRPPFRLARPGTVVRASAVVGQRVFLNAGEGVALATSGSAQYPVLSIDGGYRWQIAGPPLHVDAADGAEAVQSVGIANARTFFAYGSSVVDVTTDRGRTWWESSLGEDVVAVARTTVNALVAVVEQYKSNQAHSPAVVSQYVSRDGGRHWRYTTQPQYPEA